MSQPAEVLDEIDASLRRLAGWLDPGAPRERRMEALREIFRLNKTVGRRAMEDPAARMALKEFQLDINLITIGIKDGDGTKTDEGLRMARLWLDGMRRAR